MGIRLQGPHEIQRKVGNHWLGSINPLLSCCGVTTALLEVMVFIYDFIHHYLDTHYQLSMKLTRPRELFIRKKGTLNMKLSI